LAHCLTFATQTILETQLKVLYGKNI